MNANQVIAKIKEIKNFKVSYSELARIIGIERQNMGRYKENDLPEKHIKKIEEHFKMSLSAETLEEFINIPVRGEITASLGSGLCVIDESKTANFQMSPQLMNYLGANKTTTDIIFSQGNSMMPTIQDGDALMVDRSRTQLIDGKIYVIRIDGQLMAKRLQKIPPSTVIVISDNVTAYKPYSIDLTTNALDFEIIGQVLWYSRIAR